MTDDPSNQQAPSDSGEPAINRLRWDWRSSWQLPALLGAGALFVGAILFSILTAPKPDLGPALDRAERMIDRGAYQDALDLLRDKVHPYIADAGDTSALGRRYHLGVARALYRAQAELGIDLQVNHRNVLSHYLEAERQGAALSPRDLQALANTYLALGDLNAARVRADEIPDDAQELRLVVYRRLIGQHMRDGDAGRDLALELLGEILADPALPADDRAWALARQAQLKLDQGYSDEAITRLLRAAPRLERASPEAQGEIRLLLGRAYVEVSAMPEGERQLDQALELLPPGSPLRGEALFYLAKIDEYRGNVQVQRDRLRQVVDQHPESRVYLDALLALGEAEEALGRVDDSISVYRALVDEVRKRGDEARPSAADVSESLLSRYRSRLTRDEIDQALAFATLAGELYPIDQTPPDVLAALATAHQRAAESIIEAQTDDGRLDSLDPSSRAEAQRHLIQAGSYFRLHAEAFVLSDNERYANSLWIAADLFDRAGDRAEAIAAFRLYADGVPGDARNAEARFRLGRAFQSMGDYATAANYFRELIDEGRFGIAADVGPYADLSHVPLAQCLLADADPSNDNEAEGLLRKIISGDSGDAETAQYREALIELGNLYYTLAAYERAIETLEEARARYPDDERIIEIRFLLADAYRLSARTIDNKIASEAMPGSAKRQLQAKARERRLAAMAGYEQVLAMIERIDPRQRTALQEIQLRNSYFFLGECAFDLGDYATAIRHYDRARERYPNDPASLVAMVQIVNAHIEEGDFGRARTANERARRFYESLPEEVWDDPLLPMGRRDWERWLDSSSRLYEVSAAATQP